MQRTAKGVEVHSELEKVEKEVAIMKKLEHENLVQLFEAPGGVEERPGPMGFGRSGRRSGRPTVDERRSPVQF